LSLKKFQAAGGFGFKNRSTINWKLGNKVKATIYSNAWRVIGANSAPSKIDLPISLNSTLKKVKVALADAVIVGAKLCSLRI
jgi:hypothetical protein